MLFHTSGESVLAYHDGSIAVVYECDKLQKDGTCDPDKISVEVSSRTKDPLDAETIAKLTPIAEQLCLKASDFRVVEQSGTR